MAWLSPFLARLAWRRGFVPPQVAARSRRSSIPRTVNQLAGKTRGVIVSWAAEIMLLLAGIRHFKILDGGIFDGGGTRRIGEVVIHVQYDIADFHSLVNLGDDFHFHFENYSSV
jgi:hypothetical protein